MAVHQQLGSVPPPQPRSVHNGGMVQLIGKHHHIAVPAERGCNRQVGGKAGGEQQAVFGALQLGQGGLQVAVPAGVAAHQR